MDEYYEETEENEEEDLEYEDVNIDDSVFIM